MRESVTLPEPGTYEIIDRKRPKVGPDKYIPYRPEEDDIPAMADFGTGYHWHVTALTHTERGFTTSNPKIGQEVVERLYRKVERAKKSFTIVDNHFTDDAEILVFAYGGVARPALRAVRNARELGMKVGMIRPATIWPFPDDEVRKAAEKAKVIIAPEMNLGQMAIEVERAVRRDVPVIRMPKVGGELHTPEEILKAIKEA
jgi:2-oxoglutarate ferredoxin oxidoreductase subunit alpha